MLFVLCSFVSWAILLYARAGRGPGRARRTVDIMICRFYQCWPSYFRFRAFQVWGAREPPLQQQPDEVFLHAVANYQELCYTKATIEASLHDVRRSWAGVSGWECVQLADPASCDYRREFLLFGLAHGCLAFVRELWRRDTLPHAWGIMQSDAAKDWGLMSFHAYLARQGLRSGGHSTVFDTAFLEYDMWTSLSLVLQSSTLFLMFTALLFEVKAWKDLSRASSFVGAVLAVASAVSILVPNYARMTQLPQYFTGCGPHFDAFMQFTVSGVLGMMFAVPLCMQMFGILFAIPIAAVRGVWFVMAWFHTGTDMQHVLQATMWLLALLIPFVTVFPLMLFNQLTEDVQSHRILIAFWTFPSLLIMSKSRYTGETWFYFIWLAAYIGIMAYFFRRQTQLFDIDLSTVIANLDLPWLWSLMHADFCLTNVVVTDMLCLIVTDLGHHETSNEVSAPERIDELEIPCVGLALQHSIPLADGLCDTLAGLQDSRTVAGVSVLKFQDELFVQLAARQVFEDGHVVPLASLINVQRQGGTHP